MADLHNLLDEVEDREADRLAPSVEDAAEDPATPPPQLDGTDVETPPERRESGGGRRRAPDLPPALAEAERVRSRPRGDDDEDDDEDDGRDGEEGGYDYGRTGDPYAANADGAEVGDDSEEAAAAADPEFEQLKSLWAQELMCPEILPHDGETVALHLELLRGQEDTIEELREAAAAGGAGAGSADPMLAHLAAGVYRMEADRVRFLLADLTRTRLSKIENHALHNREMVDRMSEEEVSYLRKYGQLLERHFRRSVLNHLPKEAWKKLDEPEMIDRPDLDEFVFCRVLETVEIDSNAGQEKAGGRNDEDDEFGDESIQEFPAGSCLIARYATVRDFVLQGKVVLLM